MIELPAPNSFERVADWIELLLVLSGEPVQQGEVSAVIRGGTGDDASEAFLGSVWTELTRRDTLYATKTYTLQDHVVEPIVLSENFKLVYRHLLLLSTFGADDPTGRSQKLFERITSECLGKRFHAHSLVFGYNGRGIGEMVQELALATGERFAEEPARRFKDRGLDVVTWNPYPDNRSGNLILMTQCAAGHGWGIKGPIPMRAWEQYIHWSVAPIMGFAIATVVKVSEWHDQCVYRGIMFDRVRLLCSVPDVFVDADLATAISEWYDEWARINVEEE
jgi:hypothetical protein